MTNDRYLIVSYFFCFALSIALGALAYVLLRRPFTDIADTVSGKHLRSTLKRLFPIGIFFPALLGFVSVSYESCNRVTYEKIVENRNYLVGKNEEQISSASLYILGAVLAWNIVALIVVKHSQSDKNKRSS